MPTFVQTFNTALPTDQEDRTNGANRMREHKLAVRERYQVEHDLPAASGAGSGRHKFPYGPSSARPTDNIATPGGNIFLDTTLNQIVFWNGSAWVPSVTPVSSNVVKGNSTSPLTLTTSYQDIPGASVVIPTSGVYLFLTTLTVSPTPVDPNRAQAQIIGSIVPTQRVFDIKQFRTDVFADLYGHQGRHVLAGANGGDTVKLQGQMTTTTSATPQFVFASLLAILLSP